MRILSAFFAVLFTFINPAMIVNVITQIELFFNNQKLPDNLRIGILDSIVDTIKESDIKLRSYIYIVVVIFTCFHIGFTCCSLYGIYSCKVKFMKPLLIDIFASLIFLLMFVFFSLFMYWRLNSYGTQNEKETTKLQLRNFYVGVGFLIVYVLWAVITCMAHHDTIKLRADFMYWIEEERMSMRSRHNVSVDNRSDRSSKGSKASRASKSSARSAKSEIITTPGSEKRTKGEYTQIPTSPSVCHKVSVVNARLSVPL